MIFLQLKNKKQEKFCQLYIKNGDLGKALTGAGYQVQSKNRLMKIDKVCKRIKELQQEEVRKLAFEANMDVAYRQLQVDSLSEEKILSYLEDIYSKCMQPVEGKVVFDSRCALRAAELMGRYLGMFSNEVSVENNITLPVIKDDI